MASPKRIVSLVPSDTFNVAALGGRDLLVGRTRYCVEPPGLGDVPTVGGTKSVRVDKVIALRPDLVLANREENTRDDVLALVDAGLDVMLTFPRTIVEGLDALRALGHRLGLAREPRAAALLRDAEELRLASGPAQRHDLPSCFVAIWKKPWMSASDDTYIGDVLRWLGLRNIFGAAPSHSADGRDSRYPFVDMDSIIEAKPEIVLLPDEPYPFSDKHVGELASWAIPAAASRRIVRVSGRDLCWPGAWSIGGLQRLRAELSRLP